jgi:predicted cupin superfamily sugar epimerase
MSVVDPSLSFPIQPPLRPGASIEEPPNVQTLINKLGLQKYPEGGYFVETDRDPLRVPNPFLSGNGSNQNTTHGAPEDDSSRSASTTIYYLLTPGQPHGVFHRNKGRTMHTLHRGRGRYIIIHVDEKHGEETARIESFVVGYDIHKGERLQWMVEGGKYKASFLLPDHEDDMESDGLLISEVYDSWGSTTAAYGRADIGTSDCCSWLRLL